MPKFIDVGSSCIKQENVCMSRIERYSQHYMMGTKYMKIYEKDFRSKGG